MKKLSQIFITCLDVDEVIAHLLVTEGFSNVKEISMVTNEELSSIDGFDENLSKELKERATNYLKKIESDNLDKIKSSGMDNYFIKECSLNTKEILKLFESGIKTREDLADLSSDELIDILKDSNLESVYADKIIMDSRKHWFDKE